MKLETTDYFYILRYNEQERLIDIILGIHRQEAIIKEYKNLD